MVLLVFQVARIEANTLTATGPDSSEMLEFSEPDDLASSESSVDLPNSSAKKSAAIATRIDDWIEKIRWPAAWLSTLLLPLVGWAALRVIWYVFAFSLSYPFRLIAFLAGAISFYILWQSFLAKNSWGKLVTGLEKKLTTALFAFVTGHPVEALRASLLPGGKVQFRGKGNWLIKAGPYLFPTAGILLFLLSFLMPLAMFLPWQSFLLGAAFTYHALTAATSLHLKKTALKELQPTFCWMLVPSVIVASLSILLAYGFSGQEGLSLWFDALTEPFGWLFTQDPVSAEPAAE